MTRQEDQCLESIAEEIEIDVTANVNESDFFKLLEHSGWEASENAEVGTEHVLEEIALQFETKETWEVRPEQTGAYVDTEEARNLCEAFEDLKLEATLIQSKHDAMFAEYMASNPCDEQTPARVKRAKYSRDFYYLNARKVMLEQILQSRKLPRSIVVG